MKKILLLFALMLSINVFGQSPYQVTRIVTNFGGYWSSTSATPSSTKPNNSHELLMFRHGGVNYSTGVNDDTLTNRGISFNVGNFKALPVELNGNTWNGTNTPTSHPTYIIVGRNLDGNLSSAIHTNVKIKDLTMQSVVMDGDRGLDLGTGYTNLGSSVSVNYRISILVDSLITDNEPDLIITQIADPSTNIDTYTFVDANNNMVGNSIVFNMTTIVKLGDWQVDLFTLPFNQDIETSKPISAQSIGEREIRLAALKLSDFGLNSSNFHLVKGLRITPSGTSDVAFIGYNANAIKALPIITRRTPPTDTLVCIEGDEAILAVNVTSSYGDVLTYQWQKKIGLDWVDLSNTSKYVGVDTKTLTINYDSDTTVDFSLEKYRIKVVSTNAEDSSYSTQFGVSLQGSGCFLPITLSYFEAYCDEIKWETSSENNTKDFILFASNEDLVWDSLVSIPSAVNSNQLLTYLYKTKKNYEYFKLKQNDIDGNFEYFGPFGNTCDKNIWYEELNFCGAHPNPASDVINIRCDDNILDVNIYTLEGKKITEKNTEKNTFYKEINISGLKPSIYFYVVTMENGNVINGKFIKK